MKKKKIIGLLTIGQSPRTDMTSDFQPILDGKAEYIEAGALDGLTREQITALEPNPGEHFLVTRLADGTAVTVAAHHLSERMQMQVSHLEAAGVSAIIILCTEAFQPFDCRIPVIYPNDVLKALVPMAAPAGHIGVILPDKGQVEDFAEAWKQAVPEVTASHGSPYLKDGSLEYAATSFASIDVDLIVLDCMGYSSQQQQMVSELSGKPVLLARTLAAKVLMELI